MNYVCSRCGKIASVSTRSAQCECGGLWDLHFTPPPFDPALIDRHEWSIFRYRAFLPLEYEPFSTGITSSIWRAVTLGEGMTPIVRLDKDVLLKMDYFMPTLSFKDRGAAVLIAHCLEIGITSVAQDSSGNAGNSVAAYCARAGIQCEIFVPEGTSPAKITMIRAHGATVTIVPGSRDNCAETCRTKVTTEGIYYASHVFNPFFYEGTKTYLYEVWEQLGRIPTNIFIPIGNGTLFIGIVKGLEELLASGIISKMPQLIAIQSERCDPLARAWKDGSHEPVHVKPLPTLAEGIAIGAPARGKEILDYIYKYDVKVTVAPEDRILEARTLLANNGIYCEHTSAATYAAYLEWKEKYGRIPDCLIPMCGAGLKSDH